MAICAKDTAISLATILTVIGILTAMFFDQLDTVRADQQIFKNDIKDDLETIKTDVRDIKLYLFDKSNENRGMERIP